MADPQQLLDDLDARIQAIDARLQNLDPASDRGITEAERLSEQRNELVEQAAALLIEMDELEEP